MPKSSLEQLEEIVIRLNQSAKDGKIIVGIPTFEHVLKLVIKAIKEK